MQAVLGHSQRTALQMVGVVDAMKFRSCLTPFAEVAPSEPCLRQALDRFYDGHPTRRRFGCWAVGAMEGGKVPAVAAEPWLARKTPRQ